MRFDAIVYFATGGFALFFGLFFLVFLWEIPLFIYLCGPITFIPGTIAIVLGILQWRREQAAIEFATWVKSHRRIKMDDMSKRIGKTRFETEKLLGEALDRDLVKGVISSLASTGRGTVVKVDPVSTSASIVSRTPSGPIRVRG